MDKALAQRNLSCIQRIDPCAVAIVEQGGHAASYDFNLTTRKWEKTDIDGAMFIYERVDRPYYSMMIANRQNLSDLIIPIHAGIMMTIDKQYLFVKKSDGVTGVWFYKKEDCLKVHNLLQKLVSDLKDGKVPSREAKRSSPEIVVEPPSIETSQLLELLQRAQGSSSSSISSSSKQTIAPQSTETPSSISSVTPIDSLSDAGNSKDTDDMPVLLQKLLVQEHSAPFLKTGVMINADELEKDLLRTAKPKKDLLQEQDIINSSSAISLAALSTRSVHGSEEENDTGDNNEVESLVGSHAIVNEVDGDMSFAIGSGQNTPPLNKSQLLYAITHLLQTDDQFVASLHQAYADAMNRRLRIHK